MSPEYGATCGFFPVDDETLELPAADGARRRADRARRGVLQGERALARPRHAPEYSQVVELDLSTVEPSLAGPRRPQDRVPLRDAKRVVPRLAGTFGVDYGNGARRGGGGVVPRQRPADRAVDPGHGEPMPDVQVAGRRRRDGTAAPTAVAVDGEEFELDHGSVVIAAITSCTNTSNPQVMLGAGLLAKNAVERGLQRKPWVKSSLAPGSKVVTEYYEQAGLTQYLDELGFHTVGYGCTTCIGNSGPAAGRDLGGDRRGRPRRLLGALRATATSRRASIPR